MDKSTGRDSLGLTPDLHDTLVAVMRKQAPAMAPRLEEALLRQLAAGDADVLKRLVQSELLREGFAADSEPTPLGLALEEIIHALCRQFPGRVSSAS